MATTKYSRQRASIIEYLKNTSSHPTADTVYMHVKQVYPNISLGTVYRNLNLLAELGEAKKISIPGESDRFDGRTDNHYHVICNKCGCVTDLEFPMEQVKEVNHLADDHYTGEILSHETIFYGLCPDCSKEKNTN